MERGWCPRRQKTKREKMNGNQDCIAYTLDCLFANGTRARIDFSWACVNFAELGIYEHKKTIKSRNRSDGI